MIDKLEKFENYESTDEKFFEFLVKYKTNFDKINSNKKFDPIKESEEMTFSSIIEKFEDYLSINNS